MDYKKNLKQFLVDFFKFDERGVMYCARFGKLSFTLEEIEELIDLELKGRGRESALKKLHTKYVKIYGNHQWELIKEKRADWNNYLLKRIFRDDEGKYQRAS